MHTGEHARIESALRFGDVALALNAFLRAMPELCEACDRRPPRSVRLLDGGGMRFLCLPCAPREPA